MKTSLQAEDFGSGKRTADKGAFMPGNGRLGKAVNFAVGKGNGIFDFVGQSAEAAAKAAMEHGLHKVAVFVKGPGSGRETAIRSLQAAGLEVSGIQDKTPIAHNGCRLSKRRRV